MRHDNQSNMAKVGQKNECKNVRRVRGRGDQQYVSTNIKNIDQADFEPTVVKPKLDVSVAVLKPFDMNVWWLTPNKAINTDDNFFN